MKNRTVILIVVVGVLIVSGLIGAFLLNSTYFDSGTQLQEVNAELETVLLEKKDLKTYETFDGTLKYEDDVRITIETEGVLTYLAPEGEELSRGAEIYRVYRSLEASQILAADQQIASADASVAQAELAIENLNAAATAAQIASADASVAQAELALENLNAAATAAQIASADASLALAEANLDQGKNNLSSTQASRLISRQLLCTADTQDEASLICPMNLKGEPFPDDLIDYLLDMISNSILSTEANNLLNSQKSYEAAVQSQQTLEKNLTQALESRSALDEPPTEAQLLQATQSLQSAKEQRLALDEPPTEAQLLQATQSLQSAKEQRLALDEPPTEAQLLQATQSLQSASAGLSTALENRKDLQEGYSASVLMFGNIPAWRDMKDGITPGEDVRQLKLNLIALGYGTVETLGKGPDFNPGTRAAIIELQSDLNIVASGEIILGEVVFTQGTSLVKSSSTTQSVGGKINAGTELFYLTPVEKVETQIGSDGSVTVNQDSLQIVEIQVDVSERNLVSEASKVEIELPDESLVPGIVREVGSLAVVPQEGDPFLEVLISVDGSMEYFEWTGASVTVNVTKELASGVLATPVNGLLALLTGGYALEAVTGTGTVLIPVETGIYADGWVEVSGPGLKPGVEIVVAGQ